MKIDDAIEILGPIRAYRPKNGGYMLDARRANGADLVKAAQDRLKALEIERLDAILPMPKPASPTVPVQPSKPSTDDKPAGDTQRVHSRG